MIARLADLAEQLTAKKPDELVKILRAQGKEVKQYGDTLAVRDDGFTCGIELGAGPIDQASAMMFALFGPLGPAVPLYKGLVKELSRRYHEKRKGV